MMNFKKIISAALCIVLMLGVFCGCGEKYRDAIIYFEFLERPQTLDPQTAQSDSELLIVRNIYEGLMRETSDGKIVGGVSESYSYENLIYTFKLKDDAFWSNGEKVTAYDFEYAFRRAVNPKIKAPFANRLFSITNAEAINVGNADVSTLGVKAVDNTTLTITMCREDESFLKTLTTSVCMPCNEQFFEESIGKYGLDAKCIISNGSYRLTKWNKEDFGIRIYKNEEYNGIFDAQNAAVFISCVENEKQSLRLTDGSSDIAFVSGEELSAVKNAGFTTQSVQNICWLMTIGRNFSADARRAFAMAFSTDVFEKALPNGFTAAKSIYPETLGINTDNIGITPYNIDEAKSVMSSQIASMDDKKFPQATLYYYNDYGVKELSTAIVGHWQQNLSTFINIEASDNLDVLQREISDSTLSFSLFPITAKSDSFEEYAQIFSAVSTAATPHDLQQELLSEYTIIPVAYQNTSVTYIPELENVVVGDDNGYIDFSNIIKR
ncbi:MAG: hypothetical protein E7521_04310 [Ruminococcaceae bacterium]|nr:hypothetical protein [Oscillospiraceae bacterium]